MDQPWSCSHLLSQMQRYIELEKVQVRGCVEICERIEANRANRQSFLQASALESVAHAMVKFPSSPSLHSAALQAVLYLSSGGCEPRSRSEAVNVAMALTDCLQRNSTEQARVYASDSPFPESIHAMFMELRANCLLAMTHLALDRDFAEALRRQGAWETVLLVMQRVSTEDRVQMLGCRLLAMLSQDKGRPLRVNDPVACQLIVQFLERSVTGAATSRLAGDQMQAPTLSSTKGLWMACCAVSKLAQGNERAAKQFAHLDCCRHLERAIATSNDVLVMEWGARAVAEIVVLDPKARWAARTTGLCRAVMGMLNKYSTSPRVQFAGIYAIVNLSVESPDNKRQLAELGAARAIAKALAGNPLEVNTFEWSARALAELGQDCPVGIEAIRQAGVVRTLLLGMERHLVLPRAQFAALYAITVLAHGSNELQKELRVKRTIRLIDMSMRECLTDPNVQEWGLRALASLSVDLRDYTEDPEMDRFSFTQICHAMSNFESNPRIAEAGCWAIVQLAACSRHNKVLLGEAGACECATQIAMDFSRNENLKGWGIKALVSLGTEDNALVTKIDHLGSLRHMFQALKDSNTAMDQDDMQTSSPEDASMSTA